MKLLRIARLLGILFIVLAGAMATSIPWAISYDEMSTVWAFVSSSGITGGVGLLFWLLGRRQNTDLSRAEAILLVALSWIIVGILGGLPYLFDGVFTHPIDAYFETISGFTTTGSTVMTEIEANSKALHWWRSMTQWLGGMGIIVLFVAILPHLGVGGKLLFKSEVPGPISEGLKPKVRNTASTLWKLYIVLTFALAGILWIGCGLTFHDSCCHAFATMATGGFSTQNTSIAAYDSALVDYVITVFMLLAGVNFGLYYAALHGKVLEVLKDRELHVYLGLTLLITFIIAFQIWEAIPDGRHETFADSFRYAIFQVVGVITTTGFGTDDFNVYPPLSKMLLVTLMFMGGMAGSTAGGIKVIRFIVLFKAMYAEIYHVFRPKAVRAIRVGTHVIPRETAQGILAFFAIAIFTFVGSSIFMAALGLDLVTATTSVVATLFNIGPGLAKVGSIENFAFIPASGKAVLSFCMILGRLEFMTLLVLLIPDFWRR